MSTEIVNTERQPIRAGVNAPAEKVCLIKGHKLESFRISDLVDPIAKISIPQFELRCSVCTLTPAEIKIFRGSGRHTKSKGEPDGASE